MDAAAAAAQAPFAHRKIITNDDDNEFYLDFCFLLPVAAEERMLQERTCLFP